MKHSLSAWLLLALGAFASGAGCSSTTGGEAGDAATGRTCTLPSGGGVCAIGARCPVGDGCNSCLCGETGLVLCTTQVCNPDGGVPQDVPPARDVSGVDVMPGDVPAPMDVPADVPTDVPADAPADVPAVDAGPRQYADAMLIWQSPGGFAGWGPAVMVTGDGTVRRWQMVREFGSGNVPPADETFQLPGAVIDDLFLRWGRVDLEGLPHGPMSASDCYPSVTVRLSARGPERQLRYQHPRQLTPEMNDVWQWFVLHTPRGLPNEFCDF